MAGYDGFCLFLAGWRDDIIDWIRLTFIDSDVLDVQNAGFEILQQN